MSTSLKLTVAEYDAMVEKGAFDHLSKKIELIYGVVEEMNPAGPLHDDLIEYLTDWSVRSTTRDEIRVRIQSGLSLPELSSRPEPDCPVGQGAKLSRRTSDGFRRAVGDRSGLQQPADGS